MKTAKEMFKDLGYFVQRDDEYAISYCISDVTKDTMIVFDYEDMKVYLPDSDRLKDISIPLLEAIIQQCKELEWIKDSDAAERDKLNAAFLDQYFK